VVTAAKRQAPEQDGDRLTAGSHEAELLGPQPLPTAGPLDWLMTVPFVAAFWGVLIVFDLPQRIARLFGPRPHEIVVGCMLHGLVGALRVMGTSIEVERSPLVKPATAYLLVANHQSLLDIPVVGSLLFSNYPKYVSKFELARWIPSISYNLRRGGNALINRGNRRQAQCAISEAVSTAAERGVSMLIYPEGTRSRYGELRAFKQAGTQSMLDAAPELEIVPVAIENSWRLLANNLLPAAWGTSIKVKIGDPIARKVGQDAGDQDAAEVLDRCRIFISEALLEWRSEEPRAAAD
jgi:1-acyl-sn-glycerol-3-phosphate acyltransferase